MAVVLPNGALFRPRGELDVRRDLVEQDLVEAVIQLPKDMFYGAGIPACYLVVNRAKPAERAGRVLFVDASQCFERRDSKNHLRREDIDRIVAAFTNDDDEEGFSRWVSHPEIAERKFNLVVRRYIRSSSGSVIPTVDVAIERLRAAKESRATADAALAELLAELAPEALISGEGEAA